MPTDELFDEELRVRLALVDLGAPSPAFVDETVRQFRRRRIGRRMLSLAVALALVGGIAAAVVTLSTPGNAPASRLTSSSRPVPTYCLATTPALTVTKCMAVHEQEQLRAAQTFPATGTQLTPTQIVTRAMSTLGPPTDRPVAVYVYKTTLGGAQKLMEAGVALVPLTTPMYVVTVHFASGSVTTDVDDAVTGRSVVGCLGCDVVQAGGSVTPVPTYTSVPGTATPTRPTGSGQ